MIDFDSMSTEQQNKKSLELDSMSPLDALTLMNEEDQKVALAVKSVIPQIEKAVAATVKAFENGGRLIYIGAGTSGRLGVLDAAECPPTFGVNPEMVVGLIAGGRRAFTEAVEGAEDSLTMGTEDLKAIHLTAKDVVVGIAASGRTPYVVEALKYARSIGCATAGISCNAGSPVGATAEIPIEVTVGPEVLTGSTRLKAGTAQKMVLNMISTVSMVGIGKVYQNLMVDVQQTNLKLESRAVRIVMNATDADVNTASDTLKKAGGHVKTAITMILLNCDLETAKDKLDVAKGHIRKALAK
ncbi:MAG: N-acetylmuramic acid 6-phosphate etherase [Clostridiales bacterium]|nr:N-acetylmuramic acid 6-phosphate etherase [Clostridiales bacterium]